MLDAALDANHPGPDTAARGFGKSATAREGKHACVAREDFPDEPAQSVRANRADQRVHQPFRESVAPESFRHRDRELAVSSSGETK
jgi:hypothetical protein